MTGCNIENNIFSGTMMFGPGVTQSNNILPGTNPLFVTSVTSNNPEFAATGSTTCPSSGTGLAPGSSCTIAIAFTPP